MTAAERAQVAKAKRQAAQLEPKLRRAYLRSLERLKRQKGEVTDEDINRAFDDYRRALLDAVRESTRSGVLPPAIARMAPNVAFNVLNPRIIEAVERLDKESMARIAESVRESYRYQAQAGTLRAGIEMGLNPRTVARAVDIGLGPKQLEAVENYRRALQNGEVAKALSYKLRDHRFDASVRKGGLSEAKITKMVDAYRARFTAYNAEVNARTAAVDALRLGQQAAMEDAIERGDIAKGTAYKVWRTMNDDRVRPEHQEMEGEVVPYDQEFSNGEMVPSDWNCRCQAIYFVEENPDRMAMAREAQQRYRKELAEKREQRVA